MAVTESVQCGQFVALNWFRCGQAITLEPASRKNFWPIVVSNGGEMRENTRTRQSNLLSQRRHHVCSSQLWCVGEMDAFCVIINISTLWPRANCRVVSHFSTSPSRTACFPQWPSRSSQINMFWSTLNRTMCAFWNENGQRSIDTKFLVVWLRGICFICCIPFWYPKKFQHPLRNPNLFIVFIFL